jgi:hypothetical protein
MELSLYGVSICGLGMDYYIIYIMLYYIILYYIMLSLLGLLCTYDAPGSAFTYGQSPSTCWRESFHILRHVLLTRESS